MKLPVKGNVTSPRPAVRGRFLSVGEKKLYVRGVTYGPFPPGADGAEFRQCGVTRDFGLMAEAGINAVRVYTVPPPWLLDAAHEHGLRVMVGVPWEQHVAFLETKKTARSIVQRVRAAVKSCSGHPAVLAYAIGNEIPSSIVRWYGPRRIERYLEDLCIAAKDEDPEGLVTYVNYPSTEYLHFPAVDFLSFNVYLESQTALESYLARLQSIAGNRPLLMAEVGLDSRRNGEQKQAETLAWQVRTASMTGCAGTFVFAWSDRWFRGGLEIGDWDFGLTRRDGSPKPALEAVRSAYAEVPFPSRPGRPSFSVIVCAHNGEQTLRQCLQGLHTLDYPSYEIIVVDDGSTDATAAIANEFGVRVIQTPNRGLSSARNTGMEAASNEIVAYLDCDASPDPDWLTYLADTFSSTSHAAVGGPNIPPPNGFITDCVARSPGGPIHVLLSDREAEHIPGCNMAIRRSALQAIGGFDEQFRIAADDVDLCWRLQDRGLTLGFNPAAMVWHYCRPSIRTYLRQQKNYGRAEALLERKWPEKYNALGHLTWSGRLYANGGERLFSWGRWRIYHGVWGSGLFQSVYERQPGRLRSLLVVPEWYLVIAGLCLLTVLGHYWPAVLPLALLLVAAATGAFVIQAFVHALRACSTGFPPSGLYRCRLVGVTTLLHVLQPLVRLWGRYRYGLTPWRVRKPAGFAIPRLRNIALWSEQWRSAESRLQRLESVARSQRALVTRGGEFDRWDLKVRTGLFAAVYLCIAVEEHGAGRQMVRVRSWPHALPSALVTISMLGAVAILAALDHNTTAFVALGAAALVLATRVITECSSATAVVLSAIGHDEPGGA